jgi:hypothetical protein
MPAPKKNVAGKIAKAIENKVRKEVGMSKGITTGKAKAALKASSVYNSKTAGLGLTKGSNRKTAKVIKKKAGKK